MTPTTIIGIDPGNTGAIAWMISGKAHVMPMPASLVDKVYNDKKQGTRVHHVPVFDPRMTIYELRRLTCNGLATVFIEKQSTRPRQSSQAIVMENYGILIGILLSLPCEYREVPPKTWQKFHGIKAMKGVKGIEGTTKRQSIGTAIGLFPEIELGKHHGKADALNIAAYGQHLLEMESRLTEVWKG